MLHTVVPPRLLPRVNADVATQRHPRPRPGALLRVAPGPPLVAWTATSEAVVAWNGVLLESVRARLAKRRIPAFSREALKQTSFNDVDWIDINGSAMGA